MKIRKLLVANRGEIAVRIFATCRKLGVATVAVFSDADRGARHVREADEALHVGAAPASESYLRTDAILAAARQSGADAIHPGYGFLSENATFADAVIAEGLVWVGPPPAAIRAMGPKDAAKALAVAAGVPVLPGYRGPAQDVRSLIEEASAIGFPLLIKAVAGGGGRGIRQVRTPDELASELESARREAESAFGDGRVMLEKLVVRPRHIEVQVFADAHGNAVHLYERDCSLQRRRQKVIEEAPAPGMPDTVRKAMTEAALRLVKATGYQNAGTVEFIVDGDRPLALDNFWFLEMNTRLQVEHPVTEAITGLDLVEWQLIVASGGRLPLKQKDIRINGHAIEARICAEDPAAGFRPGAGVLLDIDPGRAREPCTLRWDAGFEAGDRVPSNYDSLLAKLIVHGPDRQTALAGLTEALSHTRLAGVPSNAGFLRRCVMSEAFLQGTHDVTWIAEHLAGLAPVPDSHRLAARTAVSAMLVGDAIDPEADEVLPVSPWDLRDGYRVNLPAVRRLALSVDGDSAMIEAGSPLPPDVPVPVIATLSPRRFSVACGGDTLLVEVPEYEADAEAALGGDAVKAPMPGRVLSISAQPGQAVVRGDVLAVLEAMKMEHALLAPRDGVVAEITTHAGAQVAEGDLLVALVPE